MKERNRENNEGREKKKGEREEKNKSTEKNRREGIRSQDLFTRVRDSESDVSGVDGGADIIVADGDSESEE